MKNFKTILLSLGVLTVFLFVILFPFFTMYDVGFGLIGESWVSGNPEIQPAYANLYRFRLTLASLGVAAVLIVIMWLLRLASKRLELVLFERLLTTGIYYVGITTALMIAGMWLDFQRYDTDYGSGERIGYFFNISHL